MEKISMDDAYLCLLSDLDDLCKNVQEVHKQAENQPTESCGTVMSRRERDNTVVDSVLTHLKKNHVDALCQTSENISQIAEPDFAAHYELELREKLSKILADDADLMRVMDSELKSAHRNIELLEKSSADLDTITSKRLEKGDLLCNPDWKIVVNKIKSERQRVVKALRYVEKKIYDESNISTILHDALEALHKGDPYIKVEDGWIDDVEFLLRSNLVMRHPHDNKRIRVIDVL